MGSDAGTEDPGSGVDPPRRRPWGYWTEAKLGLFRRYLDAFTTATKNKATERIYLDAFAGEGRGLSRTTGQEFEGSTRIALNTDDPPFTRLRFFELPAKAARLRNELERDYPGRDFEVVPGDCIDTIPQVLQQLHGAGVAWAPTFAFVDPDGIEELHWDTIAALADHKRNVSRFKVELWVLFNTMGLMRVLTKDLERLDERAEFLATRLFGTQQWTAIQMLRAEDAITPEEARDEFVNLFRWRLRHDLGYQWTHQLEIKDLHGRPLYHMVFATDNKVGHAIMAHLYNKAAGELPQMRREALDRVRGQTTLDFGDLKEAPVEVYKYEPPWRPPG